MSAVNTIVFAFLQGRAFAESLSFNINNNSALFITALLFCLTSATLKTTAKIDVTSETQFWVKTTALCKLTPPGSFAKVPLYEHFLLVVAF